MQPVSLHAVQSSPISFRFPENFVPAQEHASPTSDVHSELRRSLYQRLVASPNDADAPLAIAEAQRAIHDMSLPGVVRMAAISYLCFHYINQAQIDKAAQVLDAAPADIAQHERFRLDIAYLRAVICNRKGALYEAMEILEGVLEAATTTKNITARARALTLMATLSEALGDLSRAELLYAESFSAKEDIGDKRGIAVAAFNFACFLDRQGLYDPALEYYRRAADIERSYDDIANLTLSLSHMAILYARLHRNEQAQSLVDETIQLLNRSAPPLTAVAVLINVAITHGLLNQRSHQRATLLRALEMANTHNVDHHRVSIHLELADLAFEEGTFDTADLFVLQAHHLLQQFPDPLAEAQVLLRRARIYTTRERWDDALLHLKTAILQFAKLGAIVELGEAIELLARVVASTPVDGSTTGHLCDAIKQYRRLTDERETRRYAILMARLGTEQSRKDAEIERLRTVELAEANNHIEALNAELTEFASEKDELLAIAAHDLRNPLFEIRSTITTIVQNVHELPPNDVRALCRDALNTVTRMMATISTFLTMAQSSSKQSMLAHESINVTFLVHRAADRHSTHAQQRGVSIIVDAPGDVLASGDVNLVDAILDNLISNAIKHTEANSTIALRINSAIPSVDVIDQGPGIPPDEVNRLFTKYPNISTHPTNAEESLGLGLYLAQQMARKMGATIHYRPVESGHGSCFGLHLQPVSEARTGEATP